MLSKAKEGNSVTWNNGPVTLSIDAEQLGASEREAVDIFLLKRKTSKKYFFCKETIKVMDT